MGKVDLKWISLSINILDDEKIDLIRSQENGDVYFVVWVGLLCLAGRCCDSGRLYVFEGIPYTVDILARKLKVNRDIVSKALVIFQELGMIQHMEGDILQIINWQKWNPDERVELYEKRREQGRIRQQRFREKNKQLKIKDINITLHNRGNALHNVTESELVESFDLFWESYPRKTAKQPSLKAWFKIAPGAELVEVIVQSVENHKKLDQWKKDNGKYIPHPSTYLNQARWEDEFEEGDDGKWRPYGMEV